MSFKIKMLTKASGFVKAIDREDVKIKPLMKNKIYDAREYGLGLTECVAATNNRKGKSTELIDIDGPTQEYHVLKKQDYLIC